MVKEKMSMNILSLEAKDIVIAMAANPEVGYNIRKEDGTLSLHKFTNTLDWSLDRDKLKEAHYKEYRRKMSFCKEEKEYTQAVINVNFSLGLNEFNKFYNTYVRIGYSYEDCKFTDGICINDDVLIAIKTDVNIKEPVQLKYLGDYFEYDVEKGKYRITNKRIPKAKSADDFYCVNKNTYIRYGYTLKDCIITDGVCIDQEGKLLAIQIGVDIKEPRLDILGKTFNYSKQKHQYRISKNHTGEWNTKKLREYLYENGFVCDGIKYVRYKRSAGSAREGKCLFVDESLAKKMTEWDSCGLILEHDQLFDLASWEAYIALTMSGMIDTIDIKPENILLVEDYKARFSSENEVAVYNLYGNIEDDELGACRADVDVENKIWDGESLLDSSIFAGKYKGKGMLVLRNRFFKTCAFNTNIQKWFEDNNITNVEQLNGFTRATDITQIKLITTPSSLKYLKFKYEWNDLVDEKNRKAYEKKYSDGSAMFQYWLDNIESTFGIVKYEKQPPFFDGRLVQSHYQLLNTLHLTEGKLEELLAPSIEYLCAFRRDPAVMRYHISKSCKPEKDDDYEEEFDDEDNELDDSDDKSVEDNNDTEYENIKYEIISELLDINVNFSKTKLYNQFRNDIVESFKKRLREGRILLNGNYSTLFGNGMELLQYSTDKEIKDFNGGSVIKPGTIYTKRFASGAKILGSRSPHITMGNILIATNATAEESEIIDRYFNLSEEIVYITSIGDNILNRLNGADFDSDTILLTDNEILINIAEENYNYRRFGVPNSCFPDKHAKPRPYNEKGKSELDDMLKNDKVGRITNLSQALNSLYWDRINNGEDSDSRKNDELYFDICKLAVLSGYEIDRAKKDLPGDSNKMLELLKNKYLVCVEEYSNDKKTTKPLFFKMLAKNKGIQTGKNTVYEEFKTSMDYLQKAVKKIDFKGDKFKKGNNFSELLIKPNNNDRHYKDKLDEIIKIIRDCNDEIKKARSGYYRKSKSDKQATQREVTELKLKCIENVDKKATNNEYLLCKVLSELDNDKNSDILSLMFEVLLKKRETVKTVQKTGARKKTFRDMINKAGTIKELYIDGDSISGENYYGIRFSRK